MAKTKTKTKRFVKYYDDGPGGPYNSREKELAYRKGFVTEARRILKDRVHADDQIRLICNKKLRRINRVEKAVCRKNNKGERTHLLGYLPGHEVSAALLRGHSHALVCANQSWSCAEDLQLCDQLIIPVWVAAVERWAKEPIRLNKIVPPPQPLGLRYEDYYSGLIA